MIKLSIIVPIYGVEEYLEKCLNSLVNQTLSDIEIICVNDGSPDNSQAIIERFVAEYPEKVIGLLKDNGGLSDARNYGIPYAKGEYIAFFDSDDWADLTMYEKLYNKAIEYDADIAQCRIMDVYERDGSHLAGAFEVNVDPVTLQDNPLILVSLAPVAWDKIYRRSLFVDYGITYPKGLKYEDVGTTPMLFLHANKIVGVDEPLYYYLQREASITKVFDQHIFDKLASLERVYDYFAQEDALIEYHDIMEFYFTKHAILNMLHLVRYIDPTIGRKEGIKRIFGFVKSFFPHWNKNVYLDEDYRAVAENFGWLEKIKYKFSIWHMYHTNGNSIRFIWWLKDLLSPPKSAVEAQQDRHQQSLEKTRKK
ncbi:glycosyltransferase [Culicoidibacter larvae]|uniref:Glycosyltransferase n=1 Tax=Culicoidibacter larvae TaxID=2579976 RepID=A0A5R8QHC1_9FIRM|nr:glycosyltransferase [Culicoidibacter larvae]TLG77449.1 glycosyltransferase [Culicoidibacter larvae]